MRSKIEAYLGQATLLAIYGFFAILTARRMKQALSNPWAGDQWLINVIAQSAQTAFVVLLITMTLLRLPAKGTAAGWEPRISAIMGSFFTLTLIVLPKGQISAEVKVFATMLIVVGTVLSVYCLWWLGRSFSVMAHARRLVTEGPYSIVRHPLYAVELITLLGIAIINFSVAATLVAVVTVAFQFRRMHNEESILRETFPEYEEYSLRVARLIPMRMPQMSR